MLLLEKLDIWCFSEGLEVWLAYARVCVCASTLGLGLQRAAHDARTSTSGWKKGV